MKEKKFFTKENAIFTVILLTFFCIRAVFAVLYGVANMFGDEILNWGLSKSLFENGQTVIRGIPIYYPNNLYSVIICFVHCINNYQTSMNVARIFNALLMVLGLIPVYLLAIKMLNDKNKALFAVLLVAILPEFAYTTKLIQENVQFTIVMWLWYIAYIMLTKNKLQNKDIILLAVFSWLCDFGKEIGLCYFVGITLYFVLVTILKKDIKNYLNKLILYVTVYIILYSGYVFLYRILNNNLQSPPRLNTIPFFSIMMYIKLIYPFLVYILVLILSLCIFPVIIPLLCLKELPEATKQFLALIGSVILVSVGVILLMITRNENNDQSSIRVHLRYIFYIIPPMLTIFIQSIGKEISQYNKKLGILVGAILIILISNINIFAVMGSNIDGDSNKYLTENVIIMNFDNYKMLALSFLCIFIVWGLWCIFYNNRKVLCISVFLFYIIICLINNIFSYTVEANCKKNLEPYEIQYNKINSFINSNIKADDKICVLADEKNSETPLELALERSCYVLTRNRLSSIVQNTGIIPKDQLIYEGFISDYDTNLNIDKPRYIIKKKDNWKFSNYNRVFETNDYEVLESTDKEEMIKIESIMDTITADNWVQGDPVSITLYNQKSASYHVTIQCFALSDSLPVKISDNIGNENIYYVNTTSGNIQVDVKGNGTDPVKLTITPMKTIRPMDINPASTDGRNLSINIQKISIN